MMLNLVDQARKISELEGQLGDVAQQKDTYEKLQARARQIGKVRKHLNRIINIFEIMSDSDINMSKIPSASEALRTKSLGVLADFSKSWPKFANDNSVKSHFIDPLHAHIEKIDKALMNSWGQYVNEKKPTVTSASLEPLRVSGFGESVKKTQYLLDELGRMASCLPSSKSDIARVSEMSKVAQKRVSELAGIPNVVRVFLRKAANGTALLSDLTDEIRDWLDEHKMLDQLRVRLG